MIPPDITDSSIHPPPSTHHTQRSYRGRRNNILVGVVVKSKVGELENEVREGFSRRLRKNFNGMVESVSGKRRLLVMF